MNRGSPPQDDSAVAEVRTERMATGGEAVARLEDGRVVFVSGACANETVRVRLTEQKKRFARARAIEVVEASADRRTIPCIHAANGECGGCDWMHLRPEAQRGAKIAIVGEQLKRLGGIVNPQVHHVEMDRGRRTTVRCRVVDGKAGYRSRRSHDSFGAVQCGAAHPLLEELLVEGDFGDASEVTLRASAATGQRLVLTDGDPQTVRLPDHVQVVTADAPGDAALFERVLGKEWRVSARSFFQTSDVGAEALVKAVAAGLAGTEGAVVDLYAGVGLLGGAAAPERLVRSVESNPSSCADAVVNLGAGVVVENQRVERWNPVEARSVVADPARRGLSIEGVGVIGQTGASTLVLVSCDPASLGRDAALLREQGWRFQGADVVDMFPDTSQIEAVSVFTR